jgi:(R,R)-butanediol dehydrogenase / meso-butanediol dehydrogenase / diacetyl reductase
MKAIVWQGPERMEIGERPEPTDPGPDEVVLRPGAVGICGSEVEGYLGHMGNRTPPLVMGHEFAGEIVAGAEEWVGRRAAVNPIVGCGRCRLCRAGHENICPNRVFIGIHQDGGFADLVRAPAANLRALPDDLDIRVGALTEPLANGVHAVRLGLEGYQASSAAVIGAGTIGLVTLQAVLLSEIPSVAVIEPQAARRERAGTLGAHSVHADAEDARTAADELGFDLVLDAAGAQATRAIAVDLVRPGGRVVCIGLAADDTTLSFHTVVREQITIIGSYAYTMADFEQSLEWLAAGRASLGELTPILPLEEGPDAFARLAEAPPDQVKVFLAGAGRGR